VAAINNHLFMYFVAKSFAYCASIFSIRLILLAI
jgi:hypothetical protein